MGTYGGLLLWAASVWYWSRVLLQIRWREGEPGGTGEQSAAGSQIASWLPRTRGTATLLLAALAFLKASSKVADRLQGRLMLHAGYCLALGIAFFYFVKLRRRLLGWPLEPVRVDSWRALPPLTQAMARGALAVSGISGPTTEAGGSATFTVAARAACARRALSGVPCGCSRAARH